MAVFTLFITFVSQVHPPNARKLSNEDFEAQPTNFAGAVCSWDIVFWWSRCEPVNLCHVSTVNRMYKQNVNRMCWTPWTPKGGEKCVEDFSGTGAVLPNWPFKIWDLKIATWMSPLVGPVVWAVIFLPWLCHLFAIFCHDFPDVSSPNPINPMNPLLQGTWASWRSQMATHMKRPHRP